MDINNLTKIATNLGFDDVAKRLDHIFDKIGQQNCPLILPLVGEFSAGKTTLINALTDSKKLETATHPTTATIYEIHFGCDNCHAKVLNADNSITEIADIADLKNDVLADAKVVEVYDTSTIVPSSTILVDTPGLSSPDPRHKQTLVEFLPQSDAILLALDINTGTISRSLLDFVNDMKLAKKQVYAVITYCSSKSVSAREGVKQLIMQHLSIPEDCIACVSAKEGELDELFSLFEKIQTSKSEILQRVNDYRVRCIAEDMLSRIENLLNVSNSDKDIDEAIRNQQYQLNKVRKNIDNIIQSIQSEIEEIERNTIRGFEDKIFDRLDSIVAGKSNNFDAEAVSVINTTSTLFLSDYKTAIQSCIGKKAQEQNSDDVLQLHSLLELDLSSYNVSGISYNLNLNQAGHEYDSWISNGVKLVGVAVATCAGAGVGAAAAIDAADTATDVLFDGDSVISKTIGQQSDGSRKGLVESVVSYFTDQYAGKPQRRRAIHNYMDGTLLPEFKAEIKRITNSLTSTIRQGLISDADSVVSAMSNALEDLKRTKENKEQEYTQRVNQLQEYKIELITYLK